MRIDCVDENGRLQEAAFTKILEAASEVFRQEFDLPAEEEERLEVSLTITDEETIRQINREYRGIDRVTDVLSFPQYESAEAVAEELKSLDEEISVLLGDVVICYKRACEQAGCKLYMPPLRWCGDNGAMIGAQGYYEYLAGHTAGMNLNAYATRDISE